MQSVLQLVGGGTGEGDRTDRTIMGRTNRSVVLARDVQERFGVTRVVEQLGVDIMCTVTSSAPLNMPRVSYQAAA